jgi:hypothetical protein
MYMNSFVRAIGGGGWWGYLGDNDAIAVFGDLGAIDPVWSLDRESREGCGHSAGENACGMSDPAGPPCRIVCACGICACGVGPVVANSAGSYWDWQPSGP